MQAYRLDYNSSGARLDRLIDGKWQSQYFGKHSAGIKAHSSIVGAGFANSAYNVHLATWRKEFDQSCPKVPVYIAGEYCHIGWHGWQTDLMSGYEIQYYDWKEGRLRVKLDGGMQLEQSFAAHRLKEVHERILIELYNTPSAEARTIAKQEWCAAYV